MRVKIFQGRGFEDIKNVEDRINDWLDKAEADGSVVQKTDTGIVAVQHVEGDIEQQLVVAIWYDTPF